MKSEHVGGSWAVRGCISGSLRRNESFEEEEISNLTSLLWAMERNGEL